MRFSMLQAIYLVLAVAGLLSTWYFNIQFMLQAGGAFNVAAFVRGGFANAAAASLSSDLLVGAAAFIIWSFSEAKRLGMRHWWLYLALTGSIAFAFACPLFLLMRERKLQERHRLNL